MIEPVDSPFRVGFDGDFRIADYPTAPPKDAPGEEECKQALAARVEELHELQRVLHADDRYALLLVFQAMDAAGKDSTIRHVLSGINPAGCNVHPFERPTPEELDHDFLWRATTRLPRRGHLGVFNRSYYEEVLVVRVHPELLEAQRVPEAEAGPELWRQRLESIRDYERHLARNGTVVLKFWLNVSREEQRRRFIKRLQEPDKHWKFDPRDLKDRDRWDDYMAAYQEALAATSRPWAPWYALPADDKPYLRLKVAEIIAETLKGLPLRHPQPDAAQRAAMRAALKKLEEEK